VASSSRAGLVFRMGARRGVLDVEAALPMKQGRLAGRAYITCVVLGKAGLSLLRSFTSSSPSSAQWTARPPMREYLDCNFSLHAEVLADHIGVLQAKFSSSISSMVALAATS